MSAHSSVVSHKGYYLFLMAVLLLTVSQTASATLCSKKVSVMSEYLSADIVFIGHVTRTKQLKEPASSSMYTLKTDALLKGWAMGEVQIENNGFGLFLEAGHTYILAVHESSRNVGMYRVDDCINNKPIDSRIAALLRFLPVFGLILITLCGYGLLKVRSSGMKKWNRILAQTGLGIVMLLVAYSSVLPLIGLLFL
ncbi:hypothetical protein K8942_04960 [Candidatus Peribacteria bacterium]|nr:MAG: hypothetical protein K8942_04960 [Candidatus Peribacteria bacterium]